VDVVSSPGWVRFRLVAASWEDSASGAFAGNTRLDVNQEDGIDRTRQS